jgi:hypothetical protein
MEKVAFLVINTRVSYRLNVGISPINDANALAALAKAHEFEIYFIHNPHVRNFLRYLDRFFKNTTGKFLLYYGGHGDSVANSDAGETEHPDEAFVFDDGAILGADVIKHLYDNKNPSNQIIFMSDSCYPGSIWDIQGGTVNGERLPRRIISISSVNDSQTTKQTSSRSEQGLFASTLAKLLESDIDVTPTDLATQMNPVLKKNAQTFRLGTTSPDLLTQPFFL